MRERVKAPERKGKWVETSAWGRGFCKRTKDEGIKLPPPKIALEYQASKKTGAEEAGMGVS